jgi:hypothetical protein
MGPLRTVARALTFGRVTLPGGHIQPPDFLFVGHPRSGSGLLDSFLKGHPDVFMARKELHFFGADLGYHEPPRTSENYLQHFRGAAGHARVGEASTWLLCSETAADECKAFFAAHKVQQPKILMQLRSPVSWLHSLHSHLVFTGDEPIADFGEALAAEADRERGQRLPEWSMPRVAWRYRHHADYAPQVERWLRAFGEGNVKVIILDDMKADPEGVLDGVLDVLGVSRSFPERAAVLDAGQRARNSNRTVHLPGLRDWVNAPPQRRVLEGVDPAPVPGMGLLIRACRRANITYVPRPAMDPALRTQLTEELTPGVRRLEALLGRSLEGWLG